MPPGIPPEGTSAIRAAHGIVGDSSARERMSAPTEAALCALAQRLAAQTWLSEEEAAAYTGRSKRTLQRERLEKGHNSLPFVQASGSRGKVLYHRPTIDQKLLERLVQNTNDNGLQRVPLASAAEITK